MTKVSLIGQGKWGKVIEKTINELSLTEIFSIGWIQKTPIGLSLSTPNDLHYEQVS